MLLHPLPFTTFGEIAAHGLEVHIYCPRCYTTHRIDPTAERVRDRCFAGTRFRCTSTRYTGEACGGIGSPEIELPEGERVRAGSGIEYAELHCPRCVPPWRIAQIDPNVPPWSVMRRGDRFRCPACGSAVGMTSHGGTGIPYTARFNERT